LGNVVYERESRSFLSHGMMPPNDGAEHQYSEVTAREIDDAVKRIVGDAFDRTVALLRGKRDLLERGARELLEKETLNEGDLTRLIGGPLPQAAE